ncbi:MAG: glycosyltransferase family 4 protein [Roseofilum sp. Belize BBD 4]|uniref:glycosyltransferase family 4 protein n=1 Tax=Roseofilum sp. Belize BBD 4 TaxID=2821500 RepID=UPI001B092390|nr:glycosyltransferase family 4 protein [Roseofilum sp. Belize BBD 4]MBP0032806.1 glycosyltransferase family 4 protein [Roseofilum sp. Belize BBD 4]
MHIAWLGKKSPFCGNVTYSREVTNALLDRGHQVSFFHFASEDGVAELPANGAQASSEGWPDCPEVPIPCLYKSTIYTIPTLSSSKVLARSLHSLQPDLVHASLTLSPLDFLLPEICQDLHLPLVATFHPAFDRKLRNFSSGTQQLTYQLYAPCLANYDKTIVFSQMQREILIKLGVPEYKVVVIPNGVDALKYSPGPSSIKQQLQAERLFLYQGRIAIEKNVESLLKAWRMADLGSGCKLAIVGTGPLQTALRASYGAEQGIVWLGFIGDEQRRIEILRGTDVFILPSFVEGLSLSLLESMACGTACLATDVGADGEVLEKGAGVILNANRVTTELQTLLPLFRDHPELSIMLGQKARQRVLERYTLNRNISQVEQLYDEVIEQSNDASYRSLVN